MWLDWFDLALFTNIEVGVILSVAVPWAREVVGLKVAVAASTEPRSQFYEWLCGFWAMSKPYLRYLIASLIISLAVLVALKNVSGASVTMVQAVVAGFTADSFLSKMAGRERPVGT